MHFSKKALLVCVILLLTMAFPLSLVTARAGGGDGGGGGGGAGGGGGTGGTAAGAYGHSTGSSSSPLSDVLVVTLFGVTASGGAVLFYVRVYLRSKKAGSAMKKLSKIDASWDYQNFQRTIKDIFFAVQNAWMERNQEPARRHMSQNLYDAYSTKSEWMKVRHEKNMLAHIRLIDSLPVEIEDCDGEENDCMWVFIKAKMVDYTVDDRTMALKSGSRASRSFIEYWKLIRENGAWVLDEIRQKNELNLRTL